MTWCTCRASTVRCAPCSMRAGGVSGSRPTSRSYPIRPAMRPTRASDSGVSSASRRSRAASSRLRARWRPGARRRRPAATCRASGSSPTSRSWRPASARRAASTSCSWCAACARSCPPATRGPWRRCCARGSTRPRTSGPCSTARRRASPTWTPSSTSWRRWCACALTYVAAALTSILQLLWLLGQRQD